MEPNPGIEAARKLAHLGYRFRLAGQAIKATYHGPGKPDPHTVRPLIETMREHKQEALYFLKSYCPWCGGVATCPDYEGHPLCLACDWKTLTELYPGLRVKH